MVAELFVEGMEVAASTWEHRATLRRALMQLWNRLRHGHMSVATFGLGGVGKTTLGHLLTGDTEADKLPPEYRESLTTEQFKVDGDLPCSVIVAPGQKRRQVERPQVELRQRIASGKVAGVINVVAYGYHSFSEIGFERHRLYQPGMTAQDFMAAYLPTQRREEIQALGVLKPFLTHAPARLWMVTLVTKQDLWWAKRHEVNAHYTEGEYHAEIEEIARQLGAKHFTHRLLSASLMWNNLRDGDGKMLATTTAGYEQTTRAANMKRTANAIHELLGEGSKR